MTKKVAIQGVRGAFHEIAAVEYFGEDIECVECRTFNDVCQSILSGNADNAMMAIENTIAGSILMNYHLIQAHSLVVQGEHYVRVCQNLMTLDGVKLEDVRKVYSHPMALEQCGDFLHAMTDVRYIEDVDTALSAKMITEENLTDAAAIASERAAEIYGLKILAPSIETHHRNYTRFLVLGKDKLLNLNPNKASLRIELKHQAGALVDALLILKENNINMSKLQSVPIVGKPYEYSFYIAVEWTDYNKYLRTIEQLQKIVSTINILGEYRQGNKPG